jgi:hypothetical protein
MMLSFFPKRLLPLVALTMLLSSMLLNSLSFLPAQAEVRQSRLSQLVKKKPTLYLPARLLIGNDNKFTFQGTPGNQVHLYLSSKPEGLKTPDGQALRVGEENQEFNGTIPENGVLEIIVPLPEEEGLVGQNVFVEAIGWKADDYADLVIFDQMDATGRRASENFIAINKPSSGKGTLLMPSLPGMSTNFVQQLKTFSEITSEGDARKKELLDNGERNNDNAYDRNVFINRPGNGITGR